MSDTLNALQEANRSSSVLQAIANPPQVNPLAAMSTGVSAARNVIDLQHQQQGLQLGKLNYTAGVLADLLNQEGPISEDQVHAVAGQHVGDGIYNQDQVNSVLSTMPHNTPENPNAVRGWLRQLQIANLGHQQQIMAGFSPTTFNTGGQLVTRNVPTMPGAGGAGVPSVVLRMGLTPGEATGLDKIDIGNGQTIQVPHEMVGDLLKRNPGWKTIVDAPTGSGPSSSTAPPPPPPGTTIRSPGAYTGGSGTSTAPPPPAAPASPGGPGTYPGPGMGVLPPVPPPGPGASLSGGVQVASANPLQVPTVGAPGPASPLVPGDVNAIMVGIDRARATPASGTQEAFNALQSGGVSAAAAPATVPPAGPPAVAPVTPPQPTLGVSAPFGTGERVQADIGAYTKDAGSVVTHQGAINTLQNAYKALQLADTGPGTQNLQAARAFLQSFGIATSATGDQATQWAEAHKYLMDYARTQGLLGGTDLQAQLAQGSNASTDIPKPAALAVVRNNIARERLAIAQVQEANGSTGYVDHSKNFAPSQDLRAYQADIMPPAELKEIEALQKSNPAAFKKFQKSLDIARAHGLISDEDLAAQNQRIRAMGQ